MVDKTSTWRRAIAAAIFAGAVISSQNTVCAEEVTEPEKARSLVQQIASDNSVSHESRAYYLLQLADHYMSDKNKGDAERTFDGHGTQRKEGWRLGVWRIETQLEWWSQRMSAEGSHLAKLGDESEQFALARSAAKQAIEQLELTSDRIVKFNLYYIASMVFAKMGDTEDAQKCSDILDRAFDVCERSSSVKEEDVKAIASVLNMRAYGIIPVAIPVAAPSPNSKAEVNYAKPFSDEQFKSAERLRIRAMKIADRLTATSDTRRREHRDMYFWYLQLGKTKLAELQKQNLFELVGRSDERILYPYNGICGMVVWWQEPTANSLRMLCGVG